MATGALITVEFGSEEEVLLYRRSDGYALGEELRRLLRDAVISETPQTGKRVFKHLGLLAAHLVREIPDLYILPNTERAPGYIDYIYRLSCDSRGTLSVRVESYGKILYEGVPETLELEE